jgi:transposase
MLRTMTELEMFQAALGLGSEWQVVKRQFNADEKRLDIYIDFERGTRFECPECRERCGVYDTKEREWQHLNFFQHGTYIHARLPRVKCRTHGVKQVEVPWARAGTGFTLLLEAMIMALSREMPVRSIAEATGIQDTRIWRIIDYHVQREVESQDLSGVRKVGVDETSRRRGHRYVTLFVDMETSKVIYVTKGKDADTVKAFREHLESHGGRADAIEEFSSDLSPAFISGVGEHFPQAHMTFDRFHIMKLVNAAVDEVRRAEQQTEKGLKSTRYVWLKNRVNLTKKEAKKLESLTGRKLKTARAYRMKLVFQELFTLEEGQAEQHMKKWYGWAMRSRLEPMKRFARTLKKHWAGVLRWFTTKLTNGILEGLNSVVQAAKTRARGFRSYEYFQTMIYMMAGKMGRLPT